MSPSVVFRMQVDYMLERLNNPEIEASVREDIEQIKSITRLEVLSLELVGKIILEQQKCLKQ